MLEQPSVVDMELIDRTGGLLAKSSPAALPLGEFILRSRSKLEKNEKISQPGVKAICMFRKF
jgi:hypothetical protein